MKFFTLAGVLLIALLLAFPMLFHQTPVIRSNRLEGPRGTANFTTSAEVRPSTSYSYSGPWTAPGGNWASNSGWAPCSAGGGGVGYDHHSETAPGTSGTGSGGQDDFTYQLGTCQYDSVQRQQWEEVTDPNTFQAWKSGTASYTMTIGWTLSMDAGMQVESSTTPCEGSASYTVQVFWAIWDQTAGSNLVGNTFTTVVTQSSSTTACINDNFVSTYSGIFTGYVAQFMQFPVSGYALNNGAGNLFSLTNNGDQLQPRMGFQFTTYADCDANTGSFNCQGAESQGSFTISSPWISIS
jgi:hypothetical protein